MSEVKCPCCNTEYKKNKIIGMQSYSKGYKDGYKNGKLFKLKELIDNFLKLKEDEEIK